jgi:hypothetical protein
METVIMMVSSEFYCVKNTMYKLYGKGAAKTRIGSGMTNLGQENAGGRGW